MTTWTLHKDGTDGAQYVRTEIVLDADPTAGVVSLQLTAHDAAAPSSTDWQTGEWEAVGLTPDAEGLYAAVARLLVGEGQVLDPADGVHRVWVRIDDTPETPILPVGWLRVTGD